MTNYKENCKECPICMEEKSKFEACKQCKKQICVDCIKNIFKTKPDLAKCPYCRYEIKPPELSLFSRLYKKVVNYFNIPPSPRLHFSLSPGLSSSLTHDLNFNVIGYNFDTNSSSSNPRRSNYATITLNSD